MNLRHETFIREMIAHGNRKQAYLAAYPLSSPTAAYNNACRLLAIPQIHNRIWNAIVSAEEQTLHEFQAERVDALAEIYEKRVLLARIIKTALYPEQKETDRNSLDEEKETIYYHLEQEMKPKETIRNKRKQAEMIPTVSQILRAIVLDTKLEYGWKRKL